MTTSPIAHWDDLIRRHADAKFCAEVFRRMREQRLTFGGRLLCPFLRPFFLDPSDEARVRKAAETLWILGERIARAAVQDDGVLFRELALSEAESRLARIEPGYQTASTAARADAFLLPDSLQFAEYNAESPAGPGYSQRLAEVFAETPLMEEFGRSYGARMYRTVERLLEALLESYRDWGGRTTPPLIAIVDWREVPTFSEFELLRDAFTALGVPTIIADPRDLQFDRGRLRAGARTIDLVYRRVLLNDIVARPEECRALIDAYRDQAVCVANSLRCKIAHKKAFFAVLRDERWAHLLSACERDIIREHVPWTALLRERRARRAGEDVDLVPHVRRQRERLVIKPNDEYGGSGVVLGWEASEGPWDDAIARALAEPDRAWVVQERIPVRRETFPACDDGRLEMRDMLVDLAPYLFRGRLAGFLTRLSASGLANVTSGGGQVPSFVVQGKIDE